MKKKGKKSGKAGMDIKRPWKRNMEGLPRGNTISRRMWAGIRTGNSGRN